MEKNTNNLGLIILSVAIVLSSVIISMCVRQGIVRAAAMTSGMNPVQYLGWMNDVDALSEK